MVGVEVQIHSFLISALDVGLLLISHPGRFNPRKKELETGGSPDPVWMGMEKK
jgi:hypothetical protein